MNIFPAAESYIALTLHCYGDNSIKHSGNNSYHMYVPGTSIRTLHVLIDSTLNTTSFYNR